MESKEIQWLGYPGYIGLYREYRDLYRKIYADLKNLWKPEEVEENKKIKGKQNKKEVMIPEKKMNSIILDVEIEIIAANDNSQKIINEIQEGSYSNPIILLDSPPQSPSSNEDDFTWEAEIRKQRKIENPSNSYCIFGINPQILKEVPEGKQILFEVKGAFIAAYRLIQLYGVGPDSSQVYILDKEYSSDLRISEAIDWLVKKCNQFPNQKVFHELGFTFDLEELRVSIELHKKLYSFDKLDYKKKCEIMAKLKFHDKLPWTYKLYTELIHRYLTIPKNEYSQILRDIKIFGESVCNSMSEVMNNREWMQFISNKILEIANKL